jgi:hypothetical protein
MAEEAIFLIDRKVKKGTIVYLRCMPTRTAIKIQGLIEGSILRQNLGFHSSQII